MTHKLISSTGWKMNVGATRLTPVVDVHAKPA
jgi:hypothetical protein